MGRPMRFLFLLGSDLFSHHLYSSLSGAAATYAVRQQSVICVIPRGDIEGARAPICKGGYPLMPSLRTAHPYRLLNYGQPRDQVVRVIKAVFLFPENLKNGFFIWGHTFHDGGRFAISPEREETALSPCCIRSITGWPAPFFGNKENLNRRYQFWRA